MASVVASSSLAERVDPNTHIFLSLIIGTLVLPLCYAWIQGDGFLQKMGFIDHGLGFVFEVAGIFSLVGASVVGPRVGRFSPDRTL